MSTTKIECPICGKYFSKLEVNTHVNSCLNISEDALDSPFEEETPSVGLLPPRKITKLEGPNISFEQSRQNAKSAEPTDPDDELLHKRVPPILTTEVAATNPAKVPSQNAFDILKKSKGSPKKGGMLSDISETRKSISPRHQQKGVSPRSQSTSTATKNETETSNRQFQEPNNNAKKPTSAKKGKNLPLAERMRPLTLQDYIGQDHVLGRSKMLHKLLVSRSIPSMILWGPPGCGKTTLARIIAARCRDDGDLRFVTLSATTSGIAEVKDVVKVAKNELRMTRRKTILFVDEIHRFNKLQQDSFLPHVEDGTIILIGATTENPSFYVNGALISRCKVITLEKLSTDNVCTILSRAATELGVDILHQGETPERAQSRDVLSVEHAALTSLAAHSDGDARMALNCLQTAVDSKTTGGSHSNSDHGNHSQAAPGKQGRVLTVDDIKESLQRSHVQYDRTGEEHYNCASALQKSVRGSDANGAIYWMSRMLEGGEDPKFVARRLVVCASEDVGMADPQALPMAVACFQACTFIGPPECHINLAHCTTYLARAPKSNESYMAMSRAKESIKKHVGPLPGVPLHLRNAPTRLMKDLGYGKGYKYSHNYEGDTKQTYLPEELKNTNFFSK